MLFHPAWACPTIVTATPSHLSFDTARVAIVHQDGRTTFSVSVNPLGDRQTFALVLPVPEVLAKDEVRTLDGEIFQRLDLYTSPRRVSDAGCPYESDADADTDSDTDYDGGGGSDAGVEVEATYLVGEYEVNILSAEESTGLEAWLDANGYNLPEGAGPRLDEYIDAGSYFLAARVADEAVAANGSALSPLQVSYESPVFSIPIRLATLNSPGEQDMVIYTVNSETEGRVGISNYPEFRVPDGCRWGDPAERDFSAFYDDQFSEAWDAVGDAGWAVEFAGIGGGCTPCTGVIPTAEDLQDLGYDGDFGTYYLTRIHMRYTPEQADQDLTLYTSGIHTSRSQSYSDDLPWNECLDACGETADSTPKRAVRDGACGCSDGGSAGAFLIALAFRRRLSPATPPGRSRGAAPRGG